MLWSILLVLTVFAGLLLLVSFFGYWSATHPPRYRSAVTPASFGWPYEPVEIATADGLRLRGWLVKGEAGNSPATRAIVMLHGYPFDKGNILPLGGYLRSEFDLLLFDFRSFGESEGSATTVGYREVGDLAAAVKLLRERGYQRIGVWGFSLGGAVALLSQAADGRDDGGTAGQPDSGAMGRQGEVVWNGRGLQIDAIVADSAYADLARLAEAYYGRVPGLSWLLAKLTELWASALLGVHPRDVSPAVASRGTRTPVLLIHSRADDQIPFENALEIQRALAENSNARFWFVDGARHGEAWSRYRVEYEQRVQSFFREHLNR
ncbi:MAG: alpha/beta hydrolase [Chloroflexi bacterium]|nr:alpha/beta hydrolase [Chloroflexota bacterium]